MPLEWKKSWSRKATFDRRLGDQVPLQRLGDDRVARAEHRVAHAVVGRVEEREPPFAEPRHHAQVVLHQQLAMPGVEPELVVEALDELVEDAVVVDSTGRVR